MVGICAGISGNTTLGQLIVASPAWEYQAGKWSKDGFEIAPTQIPLRPLTRLAIEQAFSEPTIMDSLEQGMDSGCLRPTQRSRPSLAPAASGSAVIAQRSKLSHIEKQHRKVSAIDMESFGLYYAAHESSQFIPHFFSVKCVVDLGDAAKDDNLHAYGCHIAAKAGVHLVGALTGAGDPLKGDP
jgi:adenosylhomocysteine nucleosidase